MIVATKQQMKEAHAFAKSPRTTHMMHPRTLNKVRLYKSKLRPGKWVAVWVEDTAPYKDGCRQRPIRHLPVAYADTPRQAWLLLVKGPTL